MRTEQLKYGFKQLVEQILWLIYQFYDDGKVMMVTGKQGKRAVTYDSKTMFGKKGKNNLPPPPYSVEIEISSRDPQRVANQNQMFMEAYSMAAQTPYPIRLSSLLKMCNLDGKDRIIPVIEADEKYNEQMLQMQQQMEQMQAQLEQLQHEKENLQKTGMAMKNTLNTIGRRKGNNVPADVKIAGTESDQTTSAIVDTARSRLGIQTGAPLPE